MNKIALACTILLVVAASSLLFGESIHFTISMKDPGNHTFQVTLDYRDFKARDTIEFKMPVWTPGYYQRLDFAKQVKNFTVNTEGSPKKLNVYANGNAWKIATGSSTSVHISYDNGYSDALYRSCSSIKFSSPPNRDKIVGEELNSDLGINYSYTVHSTSKHSFSQTLVVEELNSDLGINYSCTVHSTSKHIKSLWRS